MHLFGGEWCLPNSTSVSLNSIVHVAVVGTFRSEVSRVPLLVRSLDAWYEIGCHAFWTMGDSNKNILMEYGTADSSNIRLFHLHHTKMINSCVSRITAYKKRNNYIYTTRSFCFTYCLIAFCALNALAFVVIIHIIIPISVQHTYSLHHHIQFDVRVQFLGILVCNFHETLDP